MNLTCIFSGCIDLYPKFPFKMSMYDGDDEQTVNCTKFSKSKGHNPA